MRKGVARWLIIVVVGCFAGVGFAAETENPTQLVQRLIHAIGSMKVANNGNLSAANEAHNMAAAKVANAILDIPGVSRWALGRHWKRRTPTEQQEFIALLEALFTKVVYPKSAEFFHKYAITVVGEHISGRRATVRTTVRDPKEGLVSVDYRLIRHDGSWRVRDILLDDVSLATNLRSQCNKIITRHSYAELLRRMRKKLAEQ